MLVAGWFLLPTARPVHAQPVVMYKSPTCTCCEKWADHLRRAGFQVETQVVQNLVQVKAQYGIGYRLESCHTAVVEGYVLEGHVPAKAVQRLLTERPAITGLSVPGMPIGSPGMEGAVREPFNVIAFDQDGQLAVYQAVR